MKTINKKISEMLKENTGVAMLDSGGAYGRHWQSNKNINFYKMPRYTIELYNNNELVYTKSVYWFLTENLIISKESERLQRLFKRKYKDSEKCDLVDMESFSEYLYINIGASGLYGEGKPFIYNTYNVECVLSQVLQYVYFELGNKQFVILQIHGGCDVRGGYTRPYIFELVTDCFLLPNGGYIFFKDSDVIDTDDGYHWYGYNSKAVVIKKVDGEPDNNPSQIMIDGKIKVIDYKRG